MNKLICYIFLTLIFFSACATAPAPAPTPTITITLAPTATPSPSPTPTPSPIFITIGSPFPLDWGNPRIWSNDSFNGPADFTRIDDHHGHMDITVPQGYEVFDGFDIDDYIGDVIAPIDGCVSIYKVDKSEKGVQNFGLHLVLEENTYIEGIENALIYAGIENPELINISNMRIDLGHVKEIKEGCFKKGEVIAEIEPYNPYRGQTKLGFTIWVYYQGTQYGFTPTLFSIDDPSWVCFNNSPYDCEPEPHDYAP